MAGDGCACTAFAADAIAIAMHGITDPKPAPVTTHRAGASITVSIREVRISTHSPSHAIRWADVRVMWLRPHQDGAPKQAHPLCPHACVPSACHKTFHPKRLPPSRRIPRSVGS
jgi:hypothetical protein